MITQCIDCAHYHKAFNNCGHFAHRSKWDIAKHCPGYECRTCLSTTCYGHCGRCGKSLIVHPDNKTASCPNCTSRIGRY